MGISLKKQFTKREWSWIFYDWANSVYATNIMAAIFPIYFASVSGDAGSKWWGLAISLSSLISAILAPTLGAIADFKGYKKKLLIAFILIGVCFTALMAVVGSWQWMLIGYVLSHIGFAGSCVFYDSFLTDVTTHERMDKVSSWGYAMGYLGGSTIPFVISIIFLMLTDFSVPAIKFSILITSVWWAAFSLPMLINVEQIHYVETPPKELAKSAAKNLFQTAKNCVRDRGMFIFILAYFFYIDGVGTIISVSTSYGSTLGLGSTGMILALLVTQLVAVPFSILFSRLAERFGSIKLIISAIAVYTCICIVGFTMGQIMEPHQLEYQHFVEEQFAQHELQFANAADDEVYSSVKVDIVDQGKDLLSAEDRRAAFDEMFTTINDRVMDENGFVYDFSTPEAKESVVANLAPIQAGLADYLSDTGKAEQYQASLKISSALFWVLAFMVGTVQGGIQALSRSYFGKLVPPDRSAEYFGFYDIFGKFAAVLGPLLYALSYIQTGRSSIGVLSLILLFVVGGLLLILGRKQIQNTEERVRLADCAENTEEA